MQHGPKLRFGLSDDVFVFTSVSLEDAHFTNCQSAGFDLQQRYVATSVDHNDVKFAVLVMIGVGSSPIDAVEQRVGV